MIKTRLLCVAVALSLAGACSRQVVGSGTIVGKSETVAVRGSYKRIALDRVDRLSLDGGSLVLHGSASTVTMPLPSGASPEKPAPHWALATDSDNGQARVLTFTHDMDLDDFTIELPRSEALIRFGGLSGGEGREFLILAWGEDSRSYYAELTIEPKKATP